MVVTDSLIFTDWYNVYKVTEYRIQQTILTLPMARSPRSKNRIIPRIKNETPNPASPTPISVKHKQFSFIIHILNKHSAQSIKLSAGLDLTLELNTTWNKKFSYCRDSMHLCSLHCSWSFKVTDFD